MTKSHSQQTSDLLARLFAQEGRAAAGKRGRPRGAALQGLLSENPAFAQQLERIRADSVSYTQEGLRQLISSRPAKAVDFRELRKSALEQAPPDKRTEQLRVSSMSRVSASSSDPTLLSGEISLTQDATQELHAHVDGDGLGWAPEYAVAFAIPFGFLFPYTTDKWDRKAASFEFDYTAPADGKYILTVTLAAYGTYDLAADDGWPDSKNAEARVTAAIDGHALTPSDYTHMNARDIFHKGDDNILEAGTFSGIVTLKSMVELRKGPQEMWAAIKAEVSARGDGSTADLNLSGPTGGAACFAFDIVPV